MQNLGTSQNNGAHCSVSEGSGVISNPRISIMMPCYNAGASVSVALASLAAQTYQDWECIVIDDGSTDHTASIIRAFEDPRIRYFRSERNLGRGHAQALALEHARGEFLANLDADDWMYPDKLECQVECLDKHPDVACVAVGLALAEPYDHIVGVQFVTRARRHPPTRHPTLRFAYGAAMVRTALARKIGFDPTFRRAQDHKFFHQLLENRSFVVLSKIAYAYTFKKGTSATVTRQGLAYNLRFYQEQFRESLRWTPLSIQKARVSKFVLEFRICS